jgi:hypothetical protein
MDRPDWLVQIYELTNGRAQDLVAELLTGVDNLTVNAGPNGQDHFMTVVLRDTSKAQSVYQLVTSIDQGAVLIHSSTEQAPAPNHD